MRKDRSPRIHNDFLLHGHLPGSGIQEHSVGGLFPFVMFAQIHAGVLVHGFMAPGQDGHIVGTYDEAHAAAYKAKLEKEALTRRQAQLKTYETSRNSNH